MAHNDGERGGGNAGNGSQSMSSGRTGLKMAWSSWWVLIVVTLPAR